jgi:hypothetical protein
MGELLSAVIADNKAGVLIFNGPGRREAAGGHQLIAVNKHSDK